MVVGKAEGGSKGCVSLVAGDYDDDDDDAGDGDGDGVVDEGSAGGAVAAAPAMTVKGNRFLVSVVVVLVVGRRFFFSVPDMTVMGIPCLVSFVIFAESPPSQSTQSVAGLLSQKKNDF